MPSYYLVECIEEALEINQKHAIKTRRSLEDRCKKDHRLLLEIVEDYLPSLIGKHLQNYLPKGSKIFGKTDPGKKKPALSKDELNNVVQEIGAVQNDAKSIKLQGEKKITPMNWSHAKQLGQVVKYNTPDKTPQQELVAKMLAQKARALKNKPSP